MTNLAAQLIEKSVRFLCFLECFSRGQPSLAIAAIVASSSEALQPMTGHLNPVDLGVLKASS